MKIETSNMLKTLRKSRRLTQEQLGFLSGMTKSQISRMENGQLGSEETTERLLDAMGFTLEVKVVDRRSALLDDRERVLDILRVFRRNNNEKYGIESLALFGSFSRNEQTPDSDIDVLISLKQPSLYLYAEIAGILESLFGRKVDLVPSKSRFTSGFMNEIKNDLIYV